MIWFFYWLSKVIEKVRRNRVWEGNRSTSFSQIAHIIRYWIQLSSSSLLFLRDSIYCSLDKIRALPPRRTQRLSPSVFFPLSLPYWTAYISFDALRAAVHSLWAVWLEVSSRARHSNSPSTHAADPLRKEKTESRRIISEKCRTLFNYRRRKNGGVRADESFVEKDSHRLLRNRTYYWLSGQSLRVKVFFFWRFFEFHVLKSYKIRSDRFSREN